MATVAVIILARNEEKHIGRAIDHIQSFATEVIVVDSGSTDRTTEIATEKGAVVLFNPWVNYSKQFQWALENAQISSDWIMRLDADEVVEPQLADEICEKLDKLPPEVTAVNLKRKHIFLGRWIRRGGRYPLVLTRIWRRGFGRIEDRWMDEHVVISSGKTENFRNPFSDYNLNDLSFFIEKHNAYATREAVDVLNQKYRLFNSETLNVRNSSSVQAALKRFVKERIYNSIPVEAAAFSYFVFRYLFQLGFLDGREGFSYHFLQGYWYRYLVGIKVIEFERQIALLGSAAERRETLATLTGLKL